MGFDDAIDNAMDIWFGDDFGDTIILNGDSINALAGDRVEEEENQGLSESLEIEFKNTDYPTISYRNDSVVFGGLTWKYPRLIRVDNDTRIVRFRRNIRPRL